ncbi:MAG: hypothetical protein M0R74_07375 [Dehalococcoidia bacterium]|nr:hypothetical protein [Dehalococcoidia bacterium]
MRFGGECQHPQELLQPLLDRERFWSPAQVVCTNCGEILLRGEQHAVDLRRTGGQRPHRWSA